MHVFMCALFCFFIAHPSTFIGDGLVITNEQKFEEPFNKKSKYYLKFCIAAFSYVPIDVVKTVFLLITPN